MPHDHLLSSQDLVVNIPHHKVFLFFCNHICSLYNHLYMNILLILYLLCFWFFLCSLHSPTQFLVCHFDPSAICFQEVVISPLVWACLHMCSTQLLCSQCLRRASKEGIISSSDDILSHIAWRMLLSHSSCCLWRQIWIREKERFGSNLIKCSFVLFKVRHANQSHEY